MNFRIFSIFILAIYLVTSEWLEKNLTGPLFTGIRHISLLSIFLFLVVSSKKNIKIDKFYIYVIIIIFILSLINLNQSIAPIFNYFIGYIFTFLFSFIFLLSRNIPFKDTNEIILVCKLFVWLIFISSIPPILLTLIQGEVMRYNFGIYREVGAFGSILNFGVILSLILYSYTRKRIYLLFAFYLSFGVFLTVLKKTIISNLVAWTFFVILIPNIVKRKSIITVFFLFFIFLMLFLGQDILQNINQNSNYLNGVGTEGHVRLGMYLASFNIANDYFPFGSGYSSFGSLPSFTNMYSKLYDSYGVSNIGANSYNDVLNGHHTLLDTFWPHILAELGYIGTIFYLIMWFYPIYYLKKIKKYIINKDLYFIVRYIVYSSVLIFFWEGFTLYTPEIPIFIFIHSGFTGMLIGAVSKSKYETILISK
jgi:hypothetical protein